MGSFKCQNASLYTQALRVVADCATIATIPVRRELGSMRFSSMHCNYDRIVHSSCLKTALDVEPFFHSTL